MPQLTLRLMDLRLIDDLFEMGGDYVLDFSNQTSDPAADPQAAAVDVGR